VNKRIEITALHRDEREFPVELAITPVAVEAQIYFSAFVRDITERKITEAALREAHAEVEQRVRERTADLVKANADLQAEILAHKQAELARSRLAAIVESSTDAILSLTPDGLVASWNNGAERIYGYAADEMVGRSVSLLVPPDRHDEFKQNSERIRHGKQIEPFDTVRMRKDGKLIHVSLTLSPIRDAAGRVTGISHTARDISEHKRLEAEVLQVSEREQCRLAQDLHDGLGQQLAGISCLTDVLQKNLAAAGSPETTDATKISRLLHATVAQTRGLARGLYPVKSEPNSLMSALRELAGRVADIFKSSAI